MTLRFKAAHIPLYKSDHKEKHTFPLFSAPLGSRAALFFFANPQKSRFDIPENPIFKNAHKSIVKLYSYFTQKRLTNPDFFRKLNLLRLHLKPNKIGCSGKVAKTGNTQSVVLLLSCSEKCSCRGRIAGESLRP